ncbi:hypothetical protein AAW14_06090 [Streptomyces hygroscopicus]|uniref:hypothetical protein n=1 Tax=Streptomyces hygroscopicus TaxID=1912 RepID=UPI0022402554|nr:hypothetical protein [Streptomyces hygroscopicus]MCW7941616.1 hypothetical protein [Streptomyces hygroscopicus]
MSPDSTTKPTGPLRCTRCGDEVGPFVPAAGLCEDCEPEAELLSALEDGGWLGDNARRLIDAYAAAVLRRATERAAE